jgi:hypothetical protein
VKPLKKPAPREKPVVLDFDCAKSTEADLVAVRDIIEHHKGKRKVEMRFHGEDGRQMMLLRATSSGSPGARRSSRSCRPWLRQ